MRRSGALCEAIPKLTPTCWSQSSNPDRIIRVIRVIRGQEATADSADDADENARAVLLTIIFLTIILLPLVNLPPPRIGCSPDGEPLFPSEVSEKACTPMRQNHSSSGGFLNQKLRSSRRFLFMISLVSFSCVPEFLIHVLVAAPPWRPNGLPGGHARFTLPTRRN